MHPELTPTDTGDLAHRLSAALQRLTESDLTTQVLIPLLRVLGYGKVEYHGGPYEGGKDIICSTTDPLGDTQITVAQVKRYQASAASRDSNRFGEVVDQLEQSLEKAIPLANGQSQLPSSVLFITPYPIDVRALQTRFERYSTLRSRRVRVLDGPELAQLVLQRLPTAIRPLLGSEPLIGAITSSQLENTALSSALQIDTVRSTRSFHSDLEFGIGRVTSCLFFSLSQRPDIVDVPADEGMWRIAKPALQELEHVLSVSLVSPSLQEVDARYAKELAAHVSAKRDFAEVSRRAQPVLDDLAALEAAVLKLGQCKSASSGPRATRPATIALLQALAQLRLAVNGSSNATWRRRQARVWTEYERLAAVVPRKQVKSLRKIVQAFSDRASELVPLSAQRLEIQPALKPPHYRFTLDGASLSSLLRDRQNWLRESLLKFSQPETSVSELREFLLTCRSLFASVDSLWRAPALARAAGFDLSQRFAVAGGMGRFEVTLPRVFSTGLNVLILGDAGAGKTTSMQAYARRLLEVAETGPVVYAPLGRVAAFAKDSDTETLSDCDRLLDAVAAFLGSHGLSISGRDLGSLLRIGRPTLLLDGIDEAVRALAWLPKAVRVLSEQIPNAHFIASSRTSGAHTSELGFLELTLLPFTPEQQRMFIRGWLGPENEGVASAVLSHLEKHTIVADIVRNPLLATVLCVLAEHEVPLPDTEVRLYEERLHLLLGVYDLHKGIQRVRSPQADLERIARKVAFALHRQGLRAAPVDTLEKYARSASLGRMPTSRIGAAVRELIDPCNVLVPMTEDGDFGFGHLRFQEYLAACELKADRGLDLRAFVHDNWWCGPMVLLAQMTDSIEQLIADLAVEGRAASARPTLLAMLAVRPRPERVALEAIVRSNADLDDGVIGTFRGPSYYRPATSE